MEKKKLVLNVEKDKKLGPGEKIVIPVNKVHSFSNGSTDEPLVTRIVVEPALDFQMIRPGIIPLILKIMVY